MSDVLASIAGKIKPFVRLLSSDQPGEVFAAARALNRLLKANGTDIFALADSVGANGNGLTETEMRKLYDAGYADGVRAAEDKLHGDEDFRNTDGLPAWGLMARWCQRRSDRLNARETDFINSVAARCVYREPTEKQAKWLKALFFRLGGRLT